MSLCPALSKASVQIPMGQLHPRGSYSTQPVFPLLVNRTSTHIPLPPALFWDQPDIELCQSPTPVTPDTGVEVPLPARPATPSRPQQRAASPTLILTLRKVPIVHFSKLFQSDSDKQIAGSPGG